MSRRRDQIQSFLASELGDTQAQLDLLMEAFGRMSDTLSQLLAHMCETGHLDPNANLLESWRRAAEHYKRLGLKARPLPGEASSPTTTCPSCQSVLREVGPGDRCDWCGFVFPALCPSCGKTLETSPGAKADICLWCQHQL